jgi:hypothetical protein
LIGRRPRVVDRPQWGRIHAVEWMLLVALATFAACEKAPPTPTDLSKTPWLDPKVQMEGLKNTDFRIRGLAAHHLGNMGARAADAVPALERIARDDPGAEVRANATKAVKKIRSAAD